MMMPADPVSHLVGSQSRFTLVALQTFFDAMLCLGNTAELR